MKPLNEYSFTEFKSIIISSSGDYSNWYFAQTRNCYFADYKPNYPEKTAADFTIVLDHAGLRPRFTLYQDTATLPTIKQYSDANKLTADLWAMRKDN